MEREELLSNKAKQYVEAQQRVESADVNFTMAENERNNARSERDRIGKDLEGHVGRNVPTKVIAVGDGKVVLIQKDLRQEHSVYVSVQDVL